VTRIFLQVFIVTTLHFFAIFVSQTGPIFETFAGEYCELGTSPRRPRRHLSRRPELTSVGDLTIVQ
jgi:hypothetical protein